MNILKMLNLNYSDDGPGLFFWWFLARTCRYKIE